MRKSIQIQICLICLIFLFTGCYVPSQYYPPKLDPPGQEFPIRDSKISGQSGQLDQEEIFQRLVRTIKSYLGTPYKYGGTSKNGIDCSGLVLKIYHNALGLRLPHSSTALKKMGIPLSVRNLAFGDLLFFRTTKSRASSHVGIYLYGTKFVHSSSSRGVIISDFSTEKYYRKNFSEARRIVNLW